MSDLGCRKRLQPFMVGVQVINCETGVPLDDGLFAYALDGIGGIEIEPEIEEGSQTVVKDGQGNIICTHRTCDQLIGHNLTFETCRFPYEFMNLITGQPIVTSGDDVVGWHHSADIKCPPVVQLALFSVQNSCAGTPTSVDVTFFPMFKFSMFPERSYEDDIIELRSVTGFGEVPSWEADNASTGIFLDEVLSGYLGSTDKSGIAEYTTTDPLPVAACALIDVPALP